MKLGIPPCINIQRGHYRRKKISCHISHAILSLPLDKIFYPLHICMILHRQTRTPSPLQAQLRFVKSSFLVYFASVGRAAVNILV